MNILYLDGGGTKLEAAIYSDNKLVESKRYGSCNITTDYDQAEQNIYLAINEFIKKQKYDGIFIAVAGAIASPKRVESLTKILEDDFKVNVKMVADIEFNYYKYFLKDDGLVINLGTGTSGIGIINQKQTIYYGLGPIFSEPGCAQDIGSKLLNYLGFNEVNNPNDKLYQRFLKDFEIESLRQNTSIINHYKNAQVAALAKWVLELTDDNICQNVAKKIIDNSFNPLLSHLKLFKDNNIYFVGGVSNNKYVQSLILSVVKKAKFNIDQKYGIEQIWNML